MRVRRSRLGISKGGNIIFWCHSAIEMSAFSAIEMSAFLVAIEQPFLPWARRFHVYRQPGERVARDESAGSGSVEGVARSNPGRAAAEGGGAAVAVKWASSSQAGEATKRVRRSRSHSPAARSAGQPPVAGGTAAEGCGGIPALLPGIWTHPGE